jgi:hypothetical protein
MYRAKVHHIILVCKLKLKGNAIVCEACKYVNKRYKYNILGDVRHGYKFKTKMPCQVNRNTCTLFCGFIKIYNV